MVVLCVYIEGRFRVRVTIRGINVFVYSSLVYLIRSRARRIITSRSQAAFCNLCAVVVTILIYLINIRLVAAVFILS